MAADLVVPCDDDPVPLACVLEMACHTHHALVATNHLPSFPDAEVSHLRVAVGAAVADLLHHHSETLHLCAPWDHHHCNHPLVDLTETAAMSCLCHFVPVAAVA